MTQKQNTEGMITFVKEKHDSLTAKTDSVLISLEKHTKVVILKKLQ